MQDKIRVLLVEDIPLAAKMAKLVLDDMGCVVDVAANGRDAVSCADKPYDLILMDIGLPDIDGYTTTETIRQKKTPEKKNPKIVALTAHDAKDMRDHSKRAGMNDYLVKPLTTVTCEELFRKHNICFVKNE